jgi:putative sterol carrier protein
MIEHRMSKSNDPTISQIIQAMPQRFNPKSAADVDATIQFILSGEDGGKYFATINNGTCSLNSGELESPTLTLKMSAQTYIDMVMGRLTGQQAFFTRKLTYKGPISLVIRLHKFFDR